jgi:hypothetical protein
MKKIIITREGMSFDLLRSYSISLNGEEKIINYQNESFFLSETNEINLNAKIDWCSKSFQTCLDNNKNEVIFNIRTNPIFTISGYLCIFFTIISSIFNISELEILSVLLGVIYILGISLFRANYLKIEEVNRG